MSRSPSLVIENTWWREGYLHVAGVDEAGRGALFGPVVAAAVVLPPDWRPDNVSLADSKLLSARQREKLYKQITELAVSTAVGIVPSAYIDHEGIVPATLMAMTLALQNLTVRPQMTIVDGIGPLPEEGHACALIDADALCASVAAASIIAKVTRDRMITDIAPSFPGYFLEQHKGYGTAVHLAALRRLGPSLWHRFSFAPVKKAASNGRPTDDIYCL